MADFELNRRLQELPDFLELSEREKGRYLRTSEIGLRFFARSEHSFVAYDEKILGFILAQAIWQGDRAILWISSIEAESETEEILLNAAIKSAYDSAIYEIHLVNNSLSIENDKNYPHFIDKGRHLVRYLGSKS